MTKLIKKKNRKFRKFLKLTKFTYFEIWRNFQTGRNFYTHIFRLFFHHFSYFLFDHQFYDLNFLEPSFHSFFIRFPVTATFNFSHVFDHEFDRVQIQLFTLYILSDTQLNNYHSAKIKFQGILTEEKFHRFFTKTEF